MTAGTIAWLGEGFAKQWQRAPDEAELRGLVEDHIREEVLYREALATGLDRNDAIVRRRMAQKMEFLSQDIAAAVEPDGKVPSVGSTVDVENATWTSTIGSPELITVWKDPDFDARLRAFYYVCVMEIPMPRWTAYDAKRFGTKPLPDTKMTVTERACTSPIWYNPG